MAIADAAYFDWSILPDVPSGLSATVNPQSVTLHWTKQTVDLQGFIVERRLRPSGAWSRVARLSSADNTYVDAKAGGALVVSYRVRAFNSAGASGYSNVATVRSSTDQLDSRNSKEPR
jgi:titin